MTRIAHLLAGACAALAVLAAVAAAPAAAGTYVNPAPAEIRAKLKRGGGRARHPAQDPLRHRLPGEHLAAVRRQRRSAHRLRRQGHRHHAGDDHSRRASTSPASRPTSTTTSRWATDILVEKWGDAPSAPGDRRRRPGLLRELVLRGVGVQRLDGEQHVSLQHLGARRGRAGRLWTGLAVTPVPAAWLVNGLPVAPVATPQPAHYWSATPLPKPALSAPRAPERVAAGVRFTASGTLSPLHLAGEHSVEIRCYRWSGGAGCSGGRSWRRTATPAASPGTWRRSAW